MRTAAGKLPIRDVRQRTSAASAATLKFPSPNGSPEKGPWGQNPTSGRALSGGKIAKVCAARTVSLCQWVVSFSHRVSPVECGGGGLLGVSSPPNADFSQCELWRRESNAKAAVACMQRPNVAELWALRSSSAERRLPLRQPTGLWTRSGAPRPEE